MLTDKLPRAWLVLGSYCVAALFSLLHGFGIATAQYLAFLASGLAVVGLWFSMPHRGSLNRTLDQVYADIKEGRQARSTAFEKVCVVVGVALTTITSLQLTH